MYHVRWEASALAELTDIWTAADSPLRKIITQVTRIEADGRTVSVLRVWLFGKRK